MRDAERPNAKRRWLCAALFLALAAWGALPASAQGSPVTAWLWPWTLRGWLQGSYYPPHNEYDPHPEFPFEERIVARYAMEGHIEASPANLPRLSLFATTFAVFGDSRPQLDYNHAADPIAMRGQWGVSWHVRAKPDLRLRLAHGRWIDLGSYRGERLIWNAVQLRWTFGYD